MISKGNQVLVTKPGSGAGGDAIVHEKDGSVSGVPGFQ
jgi:hypothetical protein